MFFSIVIPLYNKEKSIGNTLKSVLNQTFTDFEVIVVNDGSTDNSANVVTEFAKQDRRIRLVNKPNGGVCSARNRGIQEAKHEYIALLDGDDIWDNTFLDTQTKLITDFPLANLWGVNYAFVKGGKTQVCQQGMGNGFCGYVENYFGTSHNDLFCSSSVVIRKTIFEKTGLFDERIRYSEDLDMWYRIILHSKVVFYDNVLAFYNQNAENRVAYDLQIHYDLTKYLPYYTFKYEKDIQANKVFANYFCTRTVNTLLRENYWFGTEKDQADADTIIPHIRFDAIHPKYRWIFLTPRWFGWLVYQTVTMKKQLSTSISKSAKSLTKLNGGGYSQASDLEIINILQPDKVAVIRLQIIQYDICSRIVFCTILQTYYFTNK